MKKLTIGISSFLAGALLMTGVSAFASNGLQKIAANINNTIFLKLNGEKVDTAYPIITYDGRTYVYLKEVGKLVGASVEWNNDERSVEITSKNQSNNQKPDGLVLIKNYYDGREAYKYNDTIYISLANGLFKYELRELFSYDDQTKVVSFLHTDKKIYLSANDFSPNNDSFYRTGISYIKETIFIDIRNEINEYLGKFSNNT
jgi:hypothetical protein